MGLVVSEKKIFLVFPIVSLWDLSVAMETTILIQSAPKPNAINPSTQLWFTLNLIKIGLLASELFFFEIVDGRRRTTDDDDGRRMPAYGSRTTRTQDNSDPWYFSDPRRIGPKPETTRTQFGDDSDPTTRTTMQAISIL